MTICTPHRIKQFKSFTFPENGFREMNLDVDFGDVMGHRLSMKLGKQQIVWGESDLFRSIDIANPLRLDQNQAVGEAFEDFRSPIWAIKFLYDIGNVGILAVQRRSGVVLHATLAVYSLQHLVSWKAAGAVCATTTRTYIGDP